MAQQFDHGPGGLPGRCIVAGKHKLTNQAADGFIVHRLAIFEPRAFTKSCRKSSYWSGLRRSTMVGARIARIRALRGRDDILGQRPVGRRRKIDAPAEHSVLFPEFTAGALLKILPHQSIASHVLHQPADLCRDIDHPGFPQAIQPGLDNILHDANVLHHLLVGERRIQDWPLLLISSGRRQEGNVPMAAARLRYGLSMASFLSVSVKIPGAVRDRSGPRPAGAKFKSETEPYI